MGKPSKLDALAARGREAAQLAQDRLARLGVGRGGAYGYDQTTARLSFTRAGESAPWLTADASILGSFAGTSGSWLWAWANDSILEGASRAARDVLAYGRTHRITAFTRPMFIGDDEEVERLVMAAFAIVNPAGYYRSPTAKGFVLLFLHTIDEGSPSAPGVS